MASEDTATVDFLLQDLGGCGPFQWLMTSLVYGSLSPSVWGIMFMAFGVYNPGWKCDSSNDLELRRSNDTVQSHHSNVTDLPSMNDGFMTSCEGYSTCPKVVYSYDSSTIVTEWNLACDNFYIPSSIISIQMTGGLFGTFLVGFLNNWFGRKPTHYFMLVIHAALHLLMMCSVTWQMFTVFAFFSGITSACLLITAFLYPIEFITPKCRSVVAGVPMWTIGCLTFSATAMILRNWRQFQLASAILALVACLPIFFTPESLRWLTVKGKIEKAQQVCKKIAKTNRREMPNMGVISVIAAKEARREREKPRVTVLELYRCRIIKTTLVATLFWTTISVVYYGIVFGVKSLSGDFYLNLMLTTCVTVISYPLAPIVANTMGRKFGMVLFMTLAIVGLIAMIVMHFHPLSSQNGLVQLILTFIVLSCIDGAWCVSLTYTAELFPTVLRSLAFSHAGGIARVGGMVAPFLIPKYVSTLYITHIIMAILCAFTATAILFLPETNRREMADTMQGNYENDRHKTGNEGPGIEEIEHCV